MNGPAKVDEFLISYIDKIDKIMNGRFKIIDSKTGKPNNFRSEQLINSLMMIGVPLTHALKVLDIVTESLIRNHEKEEMDSKVELKTFDIRRAVRDTLYALHNIKERGIETKNCMMWGDAYIRKYGNPESPIEIIHSDGSPEKLDFETLLNDILPKALGEVLGIEASQVQKMISGKERRSMANELMRTIKEMGIYKIRSNTLQDLIKDLTMQPPHPWVIEPKEALNHMKLNQNYADKHWKNLESFFEKGDFFNCRNSIRECLHHASAAVLSYYNEIPGCGDLAPFHNLRYLVDKLNKKEEIDPFADRKIKMIERDLKLCGLDITTFLNKLKTLYRRLHNIHLDSVVKDMIPLLHEYLSICSDLTSSGRTRLRDELNIAIECERNDLKGKSFEKVICRIFKIPSCFDVRDSRRIRNRQVDMIIFHNCDYGFFSGIKKTIIVECKNQKDKVDEPMVDVLRSRIRDANRNICNTGIIVSASGFTKGAKDKVMRIFEKEEINIILLTKQDLEQIIDEDFIKLLDKKIKELFLCEVN